MHSEKKEKQEIQELNHKIIICKGEYCHKKVVNSKFYVHLFNQCLEYI